MQKTNSNTKAVELFIIHAVVHDHMQIGVAFSDVMNSRKTEKENEKERKSECDKILETVKQVLFIVTS